MTETKAVLNSFCTILTFSQSHKSYTMCKMLFTDSLFRASFWEVWKEYSSL